jgi:hypothetical protein
VGPDEVPVQFSQESIQLAVTTCLMGSTLFEGEETYPLGQLFAMLVGRRLSREVAGAPVDTPQLLAAFVADLRDAVPEDLRSSFGRLEPGVFNSTYDAMLGQARQAGVDLGEFAQALREIAVVMRHFSSRLKPQA